MAEEQGPGIRRESCETVSHLSICAEDLVAPAASQSVCLAVLSVYSRGLCGKWRAGESIHIRQSFSGLSAPCLCTADGYLCVSICVSAYVGQTSHPRAAPRCPRRPSASLRVVVFLLGVDSGLKFGRTETVKNPISFPVCLYECVKTPKKL